MGTGIMGTGTGNVAIIMVEIGEETATVIMATGRMGAIEAIKILIGSQLTRQNGSMGPISLP